MAQINIKEVEIRKVAQEGTDEFLDFIVKAFYKHLGGELTADNMQELSVQQITLLAYITLRDEVMYGGFVQLIHNGYGGFIFLNPFAKVIEQWGLTQLAQLIIKAARPFNKHHKKIEKDCDDQEFMALFEKFPEFDEFDDAFVENEEQWTIQIAYYVENHIEQFVCIEK